LETSKKSISGSKIYGGAPPPEILEPEMDFFDVSKDDCENKADEIDDWHLVDTTSADCGDHSSNDKCFCGAIFSVQALVGDPIWVCRPCFEWNDDTI
jgi:hypothetical protein